METIDGKVSSGEGKAKNRESDKIMDCVEFMGKRREGERITEGFYLLEMKYPDFEYNQR